MIDLHNHILPGIDDGAVDLAEALTMARMAVEQGTAVMAATPHRFYHGREQTGAAVLGAVERLQSALDKQSIALRLVPGIELPMRADTLARLEDGTLIPLGGAGGEYALMEPSFESIPPAAEELLAAIQRYGLTPIIAHPERSAPVQRDLGFVERCVARGMMIQLTAGSVIGKFGVRAEACARRIATRPGWPVIIASDAHESEERTPADLREAADRVAGWIGGAEGADAARRMVEERPAMLVPPAYRPSRDIISAG